MKEQVQLMYTPLFSRTEQEKNSIGVTNERVISSSENNTIGVTKEGSKFIEKTYRGYTEAICKTKFVNGLSPNKNRTNKKKENSWRHINSCRYVLSKGREKPPCCFCLCFTRIHLFSIFWVCTPVLRSTKCME